MSGHPFQSFIGLIEFDQKNLIIEQNIKQLRSDINELQAQQHTKEKELQDQHHAVLDLRKQVDLVELEVKSFDAEIAAVKKKLDAVASPREYQAVNHELAMLNEQQLAKEEMLLATWAAYEAAQKKYIEHETQQRNMHAAFIETVAQKEAALENEQAQLQTQEEERRAREQAVPQEWLQKYAAMRERVSNPVVPVEYGQCSACFHLVIDQDLIELNRKKLLQCKGCFRFLYTDAIKAA